MKPSYSWTHAAYTYRIVSALRKVYFMWPTRAAMLSSVKESTPVFKKDGKLSKRASVHFPCTSCGNKVKSTNIYVDHIDPVVPLDVPQGLLGTEEFTWDTYIARLFCDSENLWLLCGPCHDEKTTLEKNVRQHWRYYKNGKYDKAPTVRRIGKDFKTYAIDDTGCVAKKP